MYFSNSDRVSLQNYLRLKFLLLNYGKKILQNLYLKRYASSSNCCFQNGKSTNALQSGTTSANTKILPSTSMARNPVGTSIDQWDFTLLASVLLDLHANSATAYSTIPDENQHILALKNLRNDLEHNPEVCISYHSFKHYWNAALNALAALGASPEEIEHIRTTKKLAGVEFDTVNIVTKDVTLKARYLRREGEEALNAGHFEASIKCYSKAVLLSGIPEKLRGKLYRNRCEVYMTLMEQENLLPDETTSYSQLALSDIEEALYSCDSQFDCWKNWYKEAKLHKFRKDWKRAIEFFDCALDYNPKVLELVEEEREDCLQNYYGTNTLDLMSCRTLAESAILSGQKELQDQDLNSRCEYVLNFLNQMELSANLSNNSQMKVSASLFLAEEYEKGLDLPVNLEKAVAYLQVGADAGHPLALWRLGKMFWCGKGVPKNIHRAVDLWKRVASMNRDPTCPTSRGVSLENLGIAQALHSLAHCYSIGVGVHQNIVYAAELLVKSSMQGCATASRDLARMYASGCPMPKNQETAIQYLKLAVEQGCPDSAMDLCWGYLKQCNPKQAEVWLSRALATENPDAIIWRNKIEKKLKLLKKTPLTSELQLPILEHTPMTGPDAIPSQYRNSNIEENRVCIQNENLQWPFPTDDLSKFSDVFEEIRMIPSKISGGYVETLLQYMQSFEEGLGELISLESSEDYSEQKMARTSVLQKFAHCLELQQTLPALPEDLRNKLREITVYDLGDKSDSSDEIKCNARMCYVHLIKYSEEAITFVEESRRLYPRKSYFYHMHSNLLHTQQKFSEGLRVVDEGLELFPDNCELLFLRAVQRRMISLEDDIFLKHLVSIPAVHRTKFPRAMNYNDYYLREVRCYSAIGVYKEFIDKAPRDHWKISEAFYFIGNLYRLCFGFRDAEYYYNKGIDTEIGFPPCFRNDTLGKQLAELLLSIKDTAQYASKQRFHELKVERVFRTTAKYGHPLLLFPNPKRVSIVFHHRENMMYFPPGTTRKLIDQADPDVKTKLSHIQKAPISIDNLREIFLDDMDPTVDCFYENCFIDLVIMEDSLFDIELPIHSVVKDKNGDFQRLFIYNLDKKDPFVRKGLRFGSRIRIHNPSLFITTSLDGVGLRVEDPESLIFISRGDKESCRFCGQENAKHYCDECKKVKYCDSKCQKQDKNVLFHSYICMQEIV